MKGKIHSIETFGTVDGPGIRYVIFTQGCQLRCKYCHNPDTWDCNLGKEYTTEDIVKDVCKYKRYIEGVTVSGGEPLLQIDFLTQLFKEIKKENLTTCIDTNGAVFDKNNTSFMEKLDTLLSVTDLVLLDIKHIDDDSHKKLTGKSNKNILEFAKYLSQKNIDVWLRYVLVPTINDDINTMQRWKKFANTLENVKKIEVLPYHKLAINKYASMNMKYELENVSEPTKEEILFAERILIEGKEK